MLSFGCCRTILGQFIIGGLAISQARAVAEPNRTRANALPLSATDVTGSTVRNPPTATQWEGREYGVREGLDVLMRVVRDPNESEKRRGLALIDLQVLGTNLRAHGCLDELAEIYDSAHELHKKMILTCFKGSGDSRAIPVYIRTLEHERNIGLRLSAASGLAHWNIRSGVAEIVKLLDSEEPMPPPSHLYYVRDNAMRNFRLTNIRKGWGFPDDKDSAEAPPDMVPPPEVAARLRPPPTVEEIKKWFAENEHRFADWKLGDPLPPNEPVTASPPIERKLE